MCRPHWDRRDHLLLGPRAEYDIFMTNRRTFLKASSLAAVAAAGRSSGLYLPAHLRASSSYAPLGDLPRATDPQLKALAMRALDAAKSGGASYADVRFTVTRRRTFVNGDPPIDSETIAVGVRALARGAWGFAAHTDWSPDVVAQLGSKAAEQAQVDAWPRVPPIELVDHPTAASGNWEMPVKRDPFTVPIGETAAFIQSANQIAKQAKGIVAVALTFQRQDRTFASTDGAYATQTIYTSLGGTPHTEKIPSSQLVFIASVKDENQKDVYGQYDVPFVTPTGAGYEVLEDAKVLDHIPEWIEKARELARAKKFDKLGQYDVVFDAAAMASIVDGTFGAALEYDRAIGYEANAGGTSYLAPPLKILGTQYAPAAVTISADRTLPGGAATVKWDDEGVTPEAVQLVKDGAVVDYAISREFVSELAPWYHKRGVPLRSNGCSASESAFTVPLVYTPNLVLQPGTKDTGIDDLVSHIDDGLVVFGGDVQMDFQQLSGRGKGAQVYLVQHGKITEPVKDAVYTFHTQELWKRLVALGGAKTASMVGISTSKGQPNQGTVHSVKAVAAHFEKVQVDNATTA
jgi:TldD protein